MRSGTHYGQFSGNDGRRAILLLGMHSLDSDVMPDELTCGYTHVSAFREQFLRKKGAPGGCLALREGVYHHLGRFLGHDPRDLRLFLAPSTTRDLGFGTYNFYQLDSARPRSDYA